MVLLSSAFSSTSYPAAAHPNTLSAAQRSFTHLAKYLQSPLHAPSVAAFEKLTAQLESLDHDGTRSLILDSGCGLGRSTRMLAEGNPESIVIGVDRSEHRLRRSTGSVEASAQPENAVFVQAEARHVLALIGAARRARGALHGPLRAVP